MKNQGLGLLTPEAILVNIATYRFKILMIGEKILEN